jgi:hypothetical protein
MEATWATIRVALDHLFVFPEDLASAAAEDPPTLSPAEYSLAHFAMMHWSTLSRTSANGLYEHLDGYFAQLCASLHGRLVRAPADRFAHTYTALYRGFDRRMTIVGRLAAYVDRNSTRIARDEGWGWLPSLNTQRWITISEDGEPQYPEGALPMGGPPRSQRERDALVSSWELPPDAPRGSPAWDEAVVRAEASTDPAKILSVSARAIGRRRWRLAVLEPLLHDNLSQLLSIVDEDKSALEQLARSAKDVGIEAGDECRQQVGRALENAAHGEGE